MASITEFTREQLEEQLRKLDIKENRATLINRVENLSDNNVQIVLDFILSLHPANNASSDKASRKKVEGKITVDQIVKVLEGKKDSITKKLVINLLSLNPGNKEDMKRLAAAWVEITSGVKKDGKVVKAPLLAKYEGDKINAKWRFI